MEKVLGIGGFFFRARNPEALGLWYRDCLGIDLLPQSYDALPWQQQAGITVFAPFAQDSDHFQNADKNWMLNFRISDLAAMVRQLEEKGVTVKVDPEVYPNGRFARFTDPEGNPVEIWEPKIPV